MFSETPELKKLTPNHRVKMLSGEQLEQFKSATLTILDDVGIHFPSEKALEIFVEHGADVDFDSQIVKLPPDVVLEAMSHAPRYYTMGARNPDFDLTLDGTSTYCATDGCGTETIDFATRERRPSMKDDVAMMARVTDYMSSMAFYWPMVSAQDYGVMAPLHEIEASFANTVKHVQTETLMGEKEARYGVEMALAIAGDEATLRERPPLSSLICTIAPLAQDKGGIESALVFAEAGLPVGFMSMATAGSTAPATTAGTMAVADAEMVSAMALMQMAHPGAPVYHSMMPGIMHPRTGHFLGGAGEAGLFYPLGVELAHMWGVPTLAGIGTEAPTLDWESGMGMAASILMCAMCGADTASGLGLRETCTLLYPEALALDKESFMAARLYAQRLEFDQEDFALDVVRKVGPRGHYLAERHTREQMRQWELSELMYETDGKGGYHDPIEMAREKTEWIVQNHRPQPLEEEQQAELTRILQAAEKELRG